MTIAAIAIFFAVCIVAEVALIVTAQEMPNE